MKYGHIAGVRKKISRLVMGADNQQTQEKADAIFDDYVERGGNCFDTSHVYMKGLCEKLLGHWIASRGVREQVVILGKGAHPPFCDPESVTKQLLASLDSLQTSYVDLYMMHRDNPEIPVGEFAEVLNENLQAGRMHVFGVSNWSVKRIEAFNDYSANKGLAGITAVSNNLSLARMVEPLWDGCISFSDPESMAWLKKTQIPIMPWSSQGRGFFVHGDPANTKTAMLVRCWYADDNFERLKRAKQLAAEFDVAPINIALAYVLALPFPTFPLIGPRATAETESSISSLNIKLSPEQVQWLNLEIPELPPS